MKFNRSGEADQKPLTSSEFRQEPPPHQVVTLAFLNQTIPAAYLSEALARSLCAETEAASVVLVRLEPLDDSGRLDDRSLAPFALNGEFHLPTELRRADGGFSLITLGVGKEPPTAADMASLLDALGSHFRHVLVAVMAGTPPGPWFYELLSRSHLAFLFLKPMPEDLDQLNGMTREVRARCPMSSVRVKPVVCLTEGERFEAYSLQEQEALSPMHAFVHACPRPERAPAAGLAGNAPESFRADVRRLAREIGGCLVGLALSSGAAKGFAHIGVIQVLEENGIEVDVIAGASMGAYVGSLWAYGCDGRELERLARELEKRWALWTLIDPAFPPRRGFIRGFAVKKRLMRTIGNVHFASLARPLRIVATNLATLERRVFSSGEVAAAVHASTAVPGICVPISIDGGIYTDGGIVDPLPVDVLREMGVAKVIAVNVIPTPERIRQGIENGWMRTRENQTPGRGPSAAVSPLNRQVNYFARGNVLEILMRSVHGAQIRMAEASCQMADLVLRPDIFDDRWLDYRCPGRFITLGREAAQRHLAEIQSLVSRKEVIHERKCAPEPVAAAL